MAAPRQSRANVCSQFPRITFTATITRFMRGRSEGNWGSGGNSLMAANKMNAVVHCEMPYDDKNRMAKCYGNAFGWQSEMMGPEMGEYVVVSTSEREAATKFPKKPGMINGGFFKKTKDASIPSVVIAVDDIKESMKKVQDA